MTTPTPFTPDEERLMRAGLATDEGLAKMALRIGVSKRRIARFRDEQGLGREPYHAPVTSAERADMLTARRQGVTYSALARTFGRSLHTVHTIIHAARIAEKPPAIRIHPPPSPRPKPAPDHHGRTFPLVGDTPANTRDERRASYRAAIERRKAEHERDMEQEAA